MAIVYHNDVKNARMAATKTALGASGKLEIGTAGMAQILSTHPLGAGGTVTGSVWNIISSENSVAATAGGTAAAARIRTSGNADVVTGLTVGIAASDVIIDNTNIASGQTVKVNSASITHAA